MIFTTKLPGLRKLLTDFRIVHLAYGLLLLIIPLQKYFQDHYNNFTIYRYSSFHFFARTNLYTEYPKEYYDVFLYNPSFAFLFAPFAYLPVLAGIFLWVGFILAMFYFSVRLLPFSIKARLFIYFFTLLELITSLENLQINPVVAAFMLFSFIYLLKEKSMNASAFTCLGFFTKGYGAVSGALFLAKRPALKDFGWLLAWFVVLLCLPLVYYSPEGLINMYRQWFSSLQNEHSINTGISFMGMISAFFGRDINPVIFQSCAIFLLIITIILINVRNSYDRVKSDFIAYLMILIVIFNHDAESATYIIASTGVAVWYIGSERTLTDKILLGITFILTVLSPSDLFPDFIRKKYVIPYCLKALGPSLVWIKIQIFLFLPQKHQEIGSR